MAFLDEEELAPAGGGGPPSRRRPDRQRQILARRAIGAGILVIVLILVILGVKGCLDARKTRSFEDYVSDLNGIVAQTKQLSADFFAQLSDPGGVTTLEFKSEIATDRGTAEQLASRVDALDAPGELSDAQNELELSYHLRAQAMTGISDQMTVALGSPSDARNKALSSISDYMQYFLASDVLYRQAQGEIDAELADQGIDEQAPASVFMPETTRWLDELQVASSLASISAGKEATSGSHGLAVLQTTVSPGDVILSPDTPATVSGGGTPGIDVQVQNQGSVDEKSVGVTFQLTGGTQTIEGTATIPTIAAGSIQTASMPIQPQPETGTALTLEVTVTPVAGETITTNNRSTYQLTFR